MHTTILTYDADALQMESHLYIDAAREGRRPGVLVFPEAFGLGDHAKSRAERLAGLGYVTLACDLHGNGKVYNELDAVMGLINPLREDPKRTRARARGGLDALLARPEVDPARVAAIGYCFGGTMALELARGGGAIAGVVGFHSGLATVSPDDAKAITGKVLVCTGADDPGIDAAQRTAFEEEMRAGGVDWQMNVYGGVVHSFTNPAADRLGRPNFARYDAKADARSWTEMQAFFDEIFAVAA
ncbi:dienelactone hydrolase family protein (plasmid) [Sphingomonas paeninsulae]|uniref:Dienelactone hydrolase family protein n=1 Tax=Sphingomonas paeninsulae TaxID=2319844 RepID=A0A494THS5_SPHPE|nr:dienelactone hydrolase family protein [Sphingomonas paeninsulae]AYJ85361.1 dienelactone hydrolase family protein [Sphingomonas paeninsulae]